MKDGFSSHIAGKSLDFDFDIRLWIGSFHELDLLHAGKSRLEIYIYSAAFDPLDAVGLQENIESVVGPAVPSQAMQVFSSTSASCPWCHFIFFPTARKQMIILYEMVLFSSKHKTIILHKSATVG